MFFRLPIDPKIIYKKVGFDYRGDGLKTWIILFHMMLWLVDQIMSNNHSENVLGLKPHATTN